MGEDFSPWLVVWLVHIRAAQGRIYTWDDDRPNHPMPIGETFDESDNWSGPS